MPKMTISAIVRKLAEVVANYAKAALVSDQAKKVARALKAVGDAIGDDYATFTFDADGVEVLLTAQTYHKWAEAANASVGSLLELSVEANSLVKKVKGYVEDELLDGDDLDLATKTLETWESVRGSAKSPGTGTRRNGERLAQPDFNFAIFSKCELCGEEVKTGERSNRTDWNSLRHYSQKHAIDAHGSQGFRGLVSDSWREAKQAISNGMVEVVTDSSVDTPSFTLSAQV